LYYIKYKFSDRERYVLFINTDRSVEDMKKDRANDIPNAKYTIDIPGLDIVDNFLSED